MAIGATEWCNPCENAEAAGRRHRHEAADMCMRRMYGGDFFCTCDRKDAAIVAEREPRAPKGEIR